MHNLIDGVRTYQQKDFPTMRHHMQRLTEKQQPRALFITCSDARIEPNRLTSSQPGELLVIRNAGNVIPTSKDPNGVIATIEYAVNAFKVPEIVVCGHSYCGAMRAALHPDELERLPCVGAWLGRELHELADKVGKSVSLWNAAVANVQLQLQRLREITCVREAESAGDLKIHGWCHRFETGEVVDVSDLTSNQAVADQCELG